jgi:hypothetical protein
VPGKVAERDADRMALYERMAERLSCTLRFTPFLQTSILKAKHINPEPGAISFKRIEPNRDVPEHYETIKKEIFNRFTDAT